MWPRDFRCLSILLVLPACLFTKGYCSTEQSTVFVLSVRYDQIESAHFCVSIMSASNEELSVIVSGRLPFKVVPLDEMKMHPELSSKYAAFLVGASITKIATFGLEPLVLIVSTTRDTVDTLAVLSNKYPQFVFLQLNDANYASLIELSTQKQDVSVVVQPEDYDSPQTSVFSLYPVLLVYSCALASILLGSATVYAVRDQLLEQLRSAENLFSQSKLVTAIAIGLFIAFACSCLLIYYFFFDIAVYLAIALYFVIGTFTITHLLAFWIMQVCKAARRTVNLKIRLGRVRKDLNVSILQICMFPVGLSVMSIWFVYRNDPTIGWTMQSVIGVVLIGRILSSALPLSSLKMITIVFTVFVLYDVFFVFITPYFVRVRSVSPPSIEATQLSRAVRSVSDPASYMEAIATGSAGKSGESLPVSFRFQMDVPAGKFGCGTNTFRSLLGYGDAVFPGFLSTYLIFYDAIWRVRFLRNFWASIVGFILGIAVTQTMMTVMSRAQPALLYLCPVTLGVTVIVALLCGHLDELRRLWHGTLPPASVEDVTGIEDSNADVLKDRVPFVDVVASDHAPSAVNATSDGDILKTDSKSVLIPRV